MTDEPNVIPFPEREPDRVLHVMLAGGAARALVISSRDTVREAAAIHGLTPVGAAALGRLLTGAAMLGAQLKSASASVTVTVDGGGPLGKLVAVADSASVKGFVTNPEVTLPTRADGKLDVSGAVGRQGRLSVVKDFGGGAQPYVGQIRLVSGELAEDFAEYALRSEQQPSLWSLGVLTGGGAVLSAGGVMVAPMPDCPERVLSALELRAPMMADISRELIAAPAAELIRGWFDGLEPEIVGETPLSWHCGCSRERMSRALISLGREELTAMLTEPDGATLTCHFCRAEQRFSPEDLRALLAEATRP